MLGRSVLEPSLDLLASQSSKVRGGMVVVGDIKPPTSGNFWMIGLF